MVKLGAVIGHIGHGGQGNGGAHLDEDAFGAVEHSPPHLDWGGLWTWAKGRGYKGLGYSSGTAWA